MKATWKWNTLISAANKNAGFNKYRYDSAYQSIYELSNNSYIHLMKAQNKQNFIDHVLGQ